MGDGSFDHVAEIVQFVAVLDLGPPLLPGPPVRALGIARPGGVEVAVRLLRGSDYDQNTVDIGV